MKTLVTIIFGAILITCWGQGGNNIRNQNHESVTQSDRTTEHLIYKGQLVEFYVEKTIFHSTITSNFFLKFKIKNISNKTIGLDLTDYWKVIYPNQWGFYKKPYREVIDERQIIPDKTIDTIKIFKKYNEGSLTMIKPNSTLEYYREWNGSGEKVKPKNKNEYLIISVDGQLLLTNGVQLEHLTLNEADETKRAVVFNYPVNHKAVPENSLIMQHINKESAMNGLEYPNVIHIADSVAKAELNKYNNSYPNTIIDGQLSLEYYNRTLATIIDGIYFFQVSYEFNQPLGGLVHFPSFKVYIDIDKRKIQFVSEQ